MILSKNNLVLALILINCATVKLNAQPVPPYLQYANQVGFDIPTAPKTLTFCPVNTFTMEGWFYPTNLTPYAWVMGKGQIKGSGNNNISFAIILGSDGGTPNFSCSTGPAGTGSSINFSIPMPLLKWTHLAVVVNGNQVFCYFNGALVASGIRSGVAQIDPNTPFSIGESVLSDGTTNFPQFQGFAQEVRFWNVARTQNQICNDISFKTPSSSMGLVGCWPLDDYFGGFIGRDISGLSNNLTYRSSANCIPSNQIGLLNLYSNTSNAVSNNGYSINDAIPIDFNSDGLPDLITFSIGDTPTQAIQTPLRAFKNLGGGKFIEDTSNVLGSVLMNHPRQFIVEDFNGDGLKDLLVVGHGFDYPPFPGEQSRLLIQTKDGKLSDRTTVSLPQKISYTHGAAVADINGDGYPDIYMNNMDSSGPTIYINDGKGNFSEQQNRLPADYIKSPMVGNSHWAALLIDINGDGYPDLVLGSGDDIGGGNLVGNIVLMNDGKGYFHWDSNYTLPQKILGNSSVVVDIVSADFNGDGYPDLALSTLKDYSITSITSLPNCGIQILLNDGKGHFRDSTTNSGVFFDRGEIWIPWITTEDLNGDGKPDILCHTNWGAARLFLNNGDATFTDASSVVQSSGYPLIAADFGNHKMMDFAGFDFQSLRLMLSKSILDINIFKNNAASSSTPNITYQPTAVSVKSGSSATLSVTATGTGTIQYQWQKNGINIANAYSASYTIPTTQLSDGGIYSVLVGNAGGTTVSNYVPLSVTATGSPTITSNPSSQTITSGSTVVFKAAASSSTTTTYQWYLNGVAITGATSATLLIPGATSANVGTYNCTITNSAGSVTTTSAQLTLLSTTNPGRLVNLSVLTMDGPGSQMLTLGFVNGGSGTTGSEPLLIRASGPALTAFNVPTVLADPTLKVLQGTNVVVSNDNWGSSSANINAVNAAEAATGAFQLTPTTSLDAAVVQALPSVSGGYTVQVLGNGTGVGNALAEVYDNTANYTISSPRLINLSCLQQVPANGMLSAGFAISGATAKTVLIRVSGPTLGSYGVPGTMTDPQLNVFSGSTVIASNAGWAGDASITAANSATGAFQFASTTSKDSAVVMTLAPGTYTVQATSVSGTAGATMIEVYEVQ
jgi:uncharacterized lipoprotein YajG